MMTVVTDTKEINQQANAYKPEFDNIRLFEFDCLQAYTKYNYIHTKVFHSDLCLKAMRKVRRKCEGLMERLEATMRAGQFTIPTDFYTEEDKVI